MVLKEEEPITVRAGLLLEEFDFEAAKRHLNQKYDMEANMQDALAYALYGKVFEEYLNSCKEFGDLTHMGSDVFFYGLREGETAEIEVQEGKTLITKLLEIGKVDADGNRTLVFEVNGNRREIKVFDKQSGKKEKREFTQMADPQNVAEIGAMIPGSISKILIKEGEKVEANQTIAVIEAMKMETNIMAKRAGTVKEILISERQQVKTGQLLFRIS